MLKNVLSPDPLGPMMEMYSPRLTDTVTPLSARTTSPPTRYPRLTSIVRTVYSLSAAGGAVAAAAGVVIGRSSLRMVHERTPSWPLRVQPPPLVGLGRIAPEPPVAVDRIEVHDLQAADG